MNPSTSLGAGPSSGRAASSALAGSRVAARPTRPAAKAVAKPKAKSLRRVPPKSLAIFTRQLSVMIDAGLPLVQCLELLQKEEPNPSMVGAIEAVRTDIESGASLADALAKRGEAFNALYTNMVAAGEAGG